MKFHHFFSLTLLIVLSLPTVFANLSDSVDEEFISHQAEESQFESFESDNTLNLYEEMEQEEAQSDSLEQDELEQDFFPQEEESLNDSER